MHFDSSNNVKHKRPEDLNQLRIILVSQDLDQLVDILNEVILTKTIIMTPTKLLETEATVLNNLSGNRLKSSFRNVNYWNFRKNIRKCILEFIICDSIDNRLYANVEISGLMFKGLLKVEPQLVLGTGSKELLEHEKLRFRNFPGTLRTANGEAVLILGHV